MLYITLNWVGVHDPYVTLWGDIWKSKPYLDIPFPTTVPDLGLPILSYPLALSLLWLLFD